MLLEARRAKSGCPQGASGSKARTGHRAWHATGSSSTGQGSLSSGSSNRPLHGQQGRADRAVSGEGGPD